MITLINIQLSAAWNIIDTQSFGSTVNWLITKILGNFPGTFFTVWLNCLEKLVKTTRQPPDVPGETKLKVDNFPFICCIVMFVMFL